MWGNRATGDVVNRNGKEKMYVVAYKHQILNLGFVSTLLQPTQITSCYLNQTEVLGSERSRGPEAQIQ